MKRKRESQNEITSEEQEFEPELPFSEVPIELNVNIFNFFNQKELHEMRLVSVGWYYHISKFQYEYLSKKLKWFVKNEYLCINTAVRVQCLWNLAKKDRYTENLGLNSKFALINSHIKWDFIGFFWDNYPLLAVMGHFIELQDVCTLPYERVCLLLKNEWGIKLLAAKLITLKQVSKLKSMRILSRLLNERGFNAISSGEITVEKLMDNDFSQSNELQRITTNLENNKLAEKEEYSSNVLRPS